MRKARLLVQIISLALPWWARRIILTAMYGYELDPAARIGLSVVLVTKLKMKEGAKIGHLTIIRGLDSLVVGRHSAIGNLNWISATKKDDEVFFRGDDSRNPMLVIGEHAAITHRHLLDCTDTVSIGDYTIVGGWRSQILTHAIDMSSARQTAAPVKIGKYCFVGTGVVMLKGARLPDFSVLAAGSVLAKQFVEERHLYGGVPAKPLRAILEPMAYFSRDSGLVA